MRTPIAPFALVAAATAAGCFSPSYPTNLECSPTGACPPEQVCDVRRMLCIADGSPLRPLAPYLSVRGDLLYWIAGADATGFVVSRASAPGGPYTQIGTTTKTQFLDTAFTDNATYYYVVAATNANGQSDVSNEVSVKLQRLLCATMSTQILTFPAMQMGDGPPLRNVVGASTKLGVSYDLVADLVNNEIIVGNYSAEVVTVHDRLADGDAAPLRTITGGNTLLSGVYGVAVDTVHDEIFVANNGSASITVYPRTANGNVLPRRKIAGAMTNLSGIYTVALDPVHDELVAATSGGIVVTFPRIADGDVKPTRQFSTGVFITSLDVDTLHDELVVVNYGTAVVQTWDRIADGPSAIAKRAFTLSGAQGVVADPTHEEIMVGRTSGISTFARTAADPATATRVIEGTMTLFGTPNRVAVCL